MASPVKGLFVELLHIRHREVDSTEWAYRLCIKEAMDEVLNREGSTG